MARSVFNLDNTVNSTILDLMNNDVFKLDDFRKFCVNETFFMNSKEDVKKILTDIAHIAIDKHLLKSWFYNGENFVFVFKKNEEVENG